MSNILIVDDEKAIRKTLSEILSYEGYRIDEAGDGEEGIRKFRDKEYDVILCDIKMPKMDGVELSAHILKERPGIKILFMSGKESGELTVHGKKVEFLRKPFVARELSEKISSILA